MVERRRDKRNPAAKAVRTPQFRLRIVQSSKVYVRKYLLKARARQSEAAGSRAFPKPLSPAALLRALRHHLFA